MPPGDPVQPKPSDELFVPRKVWMESRDPSGHFTRQALPLSDFRDEHAWVLLGDPGSGKSVSLREEAEALGAPILRIDEFLEVGLEEPLDGKPVFLDGLDEVRAHSGEFLISKIRGRLKEYGYPKFRIACRAADWYGSSDQVEIAKATPTKEIRVLYLDPLSQEDVRVILQRNHGVLDPDSFIKAAETHRLEQLLTNPKTLEVLAKARRDEVFPRSKAEAYRLACESQVQEFNWHHVPKHEMEVAIPRLLEAAGKIFSVLLMANQDGIALSPESRGTRYCLLSEIHPKEYSVSQHVLHSRLFTANGSNRLIPNHRSIAEYLGAWWLARRIDQKDLPLRRALNLILAKDGRSVAGLRGIFAWVATLNTSVQERLLEIDPLSVILYGDPRILTTHARRVLFFALCMEIKRDIGCVWDSHLNQALGAFGVHELWPDLERVLSSRDRSEIQQELAHVVLDVLQYGDIQQNTGPLLLSVIEDESWYLGIRTAALSIWVQKVGNPKEAKRLLNTAWRNLTGDERDEFTGILLRFLYPAQIGPKEILRYIHPASQPSHLGMYRWFGEFELPKQAPDEHIPVLLDGLASMRPSHPHHFSEHGLVDLSTKLLLRGIQVHGTSVTPERLYAWFAIGTDKHGILYRDDKANTFIANWLHAHPDVFKCLIRLCIHESRGKEQPGTVYHLLRQRFCQATPPDDFGVWLLGEAESEPEDPCSRMCLEQAICCLWSDHGYSGLTLEMVLDWGERNPDRKSWIAPMLVCDLQPWMAKHVQEKKKREREQEKKQRGFLKKITPHLEAIKEGRAASGWHDHIAFIWKGWFVEAGGETPKERFNRFFGDGMPVWLASEAGFPKCIFRGDLPSATQIIDLHVKDNKRYYLQYPCLIGMEFLWQEGASFLDDISEDRLSSMIAFFLIDISGNPPEWLQYLSKTNPFLVSKIVIEFMKAVLKKKDEYVSTIGWFCSEASPQTLQAMLFPEILIAIPMQASEHVRRNIEDLLRITIVRAPDKLKEVAVSRLGQKKLPMDAAQVALWLTALLVLEPTESRCAELMTHVSSSPDLIQLTSGFLLSLDNGRLGIDEISPSILGRLAQLLMPHADVSRPLGVSSHTNARARGDLLFAIINTLAKIPTQEAAKELEALLAISSMEKVKYQLFSAKRAQANRMREENFSFPSPSSIADAFSKGSPCNSGDLAAMVAEQIEEIADDIQAANTDSFRTFWDLERDHSRHPREENYCRDQVLSHLRYRLSPLQITCEPEGDFFNDKRADIQVSFLPSMAIPIEIKRDRHKDVWTAFREQLIQQYAIDPSAKGHGIYLVFWFGDGKVKTDPGDRKKPKSAMDLKNRLESKLTLAEAARISIKVIDASWPTDPSKPEPGISRKSKPSEVRYGNAPKNRSQITPNEKARRGSRKAV